MSDEHVPQEHRYKLLGIGDLFKIDRKWYFHCGEIDRFGHFHKHGPFNSEAQAIKIRDNFIRNRKKYRPRLPTKHRW